MSQLEGAQTSRYYKPKPPLSDFIDIFWYWDKPAPAPPFFERLLPMGTVEFVIRLAKDQSRVFDPHDFNRYQEYSGSIVTGPQSKYFVLDKSEQDTLIGIHFKPGGAFPFFGVPTKELQDQHVSLEDLWGKRACDLRSELLETQSINQRFQILEKYLLSSARSLGHHPAVKFALKQFQTLPFSQSISRITNEVNLSQRRFIQIFGEQVGLTPKLFCRIQRFQEVLKRVQGSPEVDWADVALSCGYFDQAHFNHDFRDFSGLNPTRYLEHRTEHLGHVPIHDTEI